jgi:hypothetical protein
MISTVTHTIDKCQLSTGGQMDFKVAHFLVLVELALVESKMCNLFCRVKVIAQLLF